MLSRKFIRHESILAILLVLALVASANLSDRFFTIDNLLNQGRMMTEAGIIAEKIRHRLGEPYRLTVKRRGRKDDTVEHQCTATIGVALFVNHEATPDKILKCADAAMYRAKESGRNRVCFADLKLDDMS